MRNIIAYKPELGALAKNLRNTMTLGEVALGHEIKSKKLGVRFSDLDVKITLDGY